MTTPTPIQLQTQASQEAAWREANWQLIVHYAGLALQGMLANQGVNVDTKGCTGRAVELAEALVRELDRRRGL
jgi:hypothetical protein